MGLEEAVAKSPAEVSLRSLLERLASGGLPTTIIMVDGALVPPSAPPPSTWREVRLRTPAGMVTLASRGGAIAVTVFGNADAALRDAQRKVAEALRESSA